MYEKNVNLVNGNCCCKLNERSSYYVNFDQDVFKIFLIGLHKNEPFEVFFKHFDESCYSDHSLPQIMFKYINHPKFSFSLSFSM